MSERSRPPGRGHRPGATGLALLRFPAANRMLTPSTRCLAVRFLRRRLLTPAGRRWRTDGMLFLGPRLQLQIGRTGQIRFGRFVWIGHGTKIRCHEGDRRDRRRRP